MKPHFGVARSVVVTTEDSLDETSSATSAANLRFALGAYPKWCERAAGAEREVRLARLLRHAIGTVPYYKRWAASVGVGTPGLAAFPVVDRTRHGVDRRAFLSDEASQGAQDVHTNGTHSPSLAVSFDVEMLFDLSYASYLRIADALPDVAHGAVSGVPTVFIISDMLTDVQTSVMMPSLNATILRRLVVRRSSESDARIVEYLRSREVALLHGKPSALLHLMDVDRLHGGGPIRPRAVVTSGENSYSDDRAQLEAWFGCPTLDAYVATEAGMIALECSRRSGLHVLDDRVVLEVERGDGAVAPLGEGELIVTNLINWRHVFVRYMLGDFGVVVNASCACGHAGPTIVALPGRERRRYRIRSASIEARELELVLRQSGVRQYQVSSDGVSLIVRWISSDTDVVTGERRLSSALEECLGSRDYVLRRVESINQPGGKLRRFL